MQNWIFFDLGSTLLDESERVEERIAATAQRNGPELGSFYTMLQSAAQTHPYVLKMDLPNGAVWVQWPKRLDPLYPDALELLRVLRGQYRLGVIANHAVDTAQRLGIASYFDVIVTSEELAIAKPDPHIFQQALACANCAPEEAIMVGDRLDNDIAPAKRLGMKTIWIRQGWGGVPEPQSDEETPDRQVNDLKELRALLCSD